MSGRISAKAEKIRDLFVKQPDLDVHLVAKEFGLSTNRIYTLRTQARALAKKAKKAPGPTTAPIKRRKHRATAAVVVDDQTEVGRLRTANLRLKKIIFELLSGDL